MTGAIHVLEGRRGSDLFATAEFFGLDVTDLLPRRVTPAHPQGQEKSPSTEVKGDDLVAGAGFEPTTSGL